MVSLLDVIIFTNNVPDIKQLWKLLMTTGINGMITHIGTNFVGFKTINVPVHYPRNFTDNWTGIRHHWSRNICLQMRFTLGWYSYFPYNYVHIATLFIASIKLILFVRNMNKRVIDNHYFETSIWFQLTSAFHLNWEIYLVHICCSICLNGNFKIQKQKILTGIKTLRRMFYNRFWSGFLGVFAVTQIFHLLHNPEFLVIHFTSTIYSLLNQICISKAAN